MHLAFSALASLSMLGAYLALGRLRTPPVPAPVLGMVLGFVAGCACAAALTTTHP